MAPERKLESLLAAIDAANAGDPRSIEVDGVAKPFEVVYAQRMTACLERLYPEASDFLKIAARAQHLRRFEIPRADFPQGRHGYNEWRKRCRDHHARLCEELMRQHGYSEPEIERVAGLIRKERLKKDKECQALENVAAIVFLEHYFESFLEKYRDYDDEKLVDIIGKTLCKMSPKGHAAALALNLPERTRRLVATAIEAQARALEKLAEVAVD